MIKILRYTEYLYLAVFVFSLYRIYTDWNIDRQGAYLFVFFAVVSIGMFFFRRNYRKKFEKRKRDNEN
jgi:L-asparagine transporter-like permease